MSNDDPYADLPSAIAAPALATSFVASPKRSREADDVPSTKKVARRDMRHVAFRDENDVDATVEEPVDEVKQPLKVLDIRQTIEKLKGYMKFGKASALFSALLEEQCTSTPRPDEHTMSLLMECVQTIMNSKPERTHHASFRAAYAALVRVVDKHRTSLLRASDFDSDEIDNWVLDAVLHNDLFTDDTYVFAKAANLIAAHITGRRDEAVSMENLADVAALDRVLLPCLRSLMARHGTAWAKTSVEMVLALCTYRRLTFHDGDRKEVDEWTSTIHQRKVAPSSRGKHAAAAAEMRKNIVAYNDTQTGIKVGKSNHPLFNKD
ncbi:hypothetical protein DYB26_011668 [Aphanomyces astaci]|uniref:Uncharacterized protein n=1 Tax=Aphanomyces astaci TaxID=112090 RepID=A0A397ENC0_APHAT|nr:hypothetical protein DYB31_016056 [Aphanomyces astaci]RHZ19915.1 hypothetical protein DYB26_011668 [Aphanomyces astaci]